MPADVSLPPEAAVVRARCERTAVERCQLTFGKRADLGSVMPILLVRVRWGRAIGWVCKPEVTGSIPVRSTGKSLHTARARADGASGARTGRARAAHPGRAREWQELRQIARDLNAAETPTAHGGAQWWPSTVRAVLVPGGSGTWA